MRFEQIENFKEVMLKKLSEDKRHDDEAGVHPRSSTTSSSNIRNLGQTNTHDTYFANISRIRAKKERKSLLVWCNTPTDREAFGMPEALREKDGHVQNLRDEQEYGAQAVYQSKPDHPATVCDKFSNGLGKAANDAMKGSDPALHRPPTDREMFEMPQTLHDGDPNKATDDTDMQIVTQSMSDEDDPHIEIVPQLKEEAFTSGGDKIEDAPKGDVVAARSPSCGKLFQQVPLFQSAYRTLKTSNTDSRKTETRFNSDIPSTSVRACKSVLKNAHMSNDEHEHSHAENTRQAKRARLE